MTRTLKVYHGTLDGRGDAIVAAYNQREAAALTHHTLHGFRSYWTETWDADDRSQALLYPGRVWVRRNIHSPWLEKVWAT